MSYDPAVSGPWSDAEDYPLVDESVPSCPVCGLALVYMTAPFMPNAFADAGWVCPNHGKFRVSQ